MSHPPRLRNQRQLFIGMLAGLIIGSLLGASLVSWVYIHRGFNPVGIDREDDIVAAFHRLYHNNWWSRAVTNTYWLGTQTVQCPLDMWVLQEIIHETKPDVIVETGTMLGGSALFFASMMDLEKHGRVISIDIEDKPGKPKHDRITYLVGSSTSDGILQTVSHLIAPGEKVLVFLDSDHSKSHVLNELKLYSRFVGAGCYLVVSDTHLNGHPIYNPISPGPGPMEAVDEFLAQNHQFSIDSSREKYGLTFSPRGYLVHRQAQ